MTQKLDHYKCCTCGTRYSEHRKECFYCGKTDTIRFEQIRNIPKPKKAYYGATINIRIK